MTTVNTTMAVAKVDNLTGSPANVISLRVLDSKGIAVVNQAVPSAPGAAFPAVDAALPPDTYTWECQCLNTKGSRIGELFTGSFTVVPPQAYVPVSLTITLG
jgi:hypothetical protein